MLRHPCVVFLVFWTVCCSLAFADDHIDRKITEAALQETREIILNEMFGHYDVTDLVVLRMDGLQGRISLGHDYALMRITLKFSTKRNATKYPHLHRDMFEHGNERCQGWLYLHCGVPFGHVFEGKFEVLMAGNRDGSWRVVSPSWRSRRALSAPWLPTLIR